MWALRYELDPLVRASAAHSLVLLAGNQDQDVLDALQERYLIDSDPIVKKLAFLKFLFIYDLKILNLIQRAQ